MTGGRGALLVLSLAMDPRRRSTRTTATTITATTAMIHNQISMAGSLLAPVCAAVAASVRLAQRDVHDLNVGDEAARGYQPRAAASETGLSTQ